MNREQSFTLLGSRCSVRVHVQAVGSVFAVRGFIVRRTPQLEHGGQHRTPEGARTPNTEHRTSHFEPNSNVNTNPALRTEKRERRGSPDA
jgi:hypothetical protein